MSEYKYTADSQVIQSIERVRQKIVRFRGVVEDTTAARRDHKRRCRLEKDKELEALARIMDNYNPAIPEKPALVIPSDRSSDLLDKCTQIGEKLIRSSQNLQQLLQFVKDIEFTQRNSVAVGTQSEYKLYQFTSCERLRKLHEKRGDACIMERLFCSSLLAVVGKKQRTKLRVYHFRKETEICNYNYSNKILNVKLNSQRLIVVLEDSVFIHDLEDLKVIHTISDTPPNPSGVCALSSSSDRSYLAYPGSSQVGQVHIFDTVSMQSVIMIEAHESPLAALAFTYDGTKLATASEKGTIIRVFKSADGTKQIEFRRGVKRCVEISCLAFSTDGMYLCTSSNTETVHIFRLELQRETQEEEPQGWIDYFGKVLATPASYLPTQVTDVFTQGRAFAMAHLEKPGQKKICAITILQGIHRLLVVTSDAIIRIYHINPVEGGECVLFKEHNLLTLDEKEN